MQLIDRKNPINCSDKYYNLNYRWIGRCSLAEGATQQLVKNQRKHEYLYTTPATVYDTRNRLGKILGVNIHTNLFVSNQVKNQMQDAEISGLDYIPALALCKALRTGKEQAYWQIVVTGWGGFVAQESIHWCDETDGLKLRRYSGLDNRQQLLRDGECDRYDFFRVWPIPGEIFVSRRAAMQLHAWLGKDLNLIPLSEFKLPSIAGKVVDIRVQPLMCYLPPKLGEEIGRPLGIDWW